MQSRKLSAVESVCNVASGMLVSLALWEWIAPLYGIHASHVVNVQFVGIFTVASLVRSYAWRRFFTRLFT